MSYIRLQNLKEFEALGERNLIPLKSISNGFFKANFRVKHPKNPLQQLLHLHVLD